MDDQRVNRNVFALLYSFSILYPVFAFVTLVLQACGRNTLFALLTDGNTVLLFLVQLAGYAVLVYAGLYLGKGVGLGAPFLECWARGEPVRARARSALKVSLPLGLGVAAVKYLLDHLVFSPFVPATVSWGGLDLFLLRLAIPFQQGIGDEITYRLFWMTATVWVLWKIQRSGDTPPLGRKYWAGILLAGFISLLGPVVWMATSLAKVQYAVIILTGAIPFGWLYWKKGIESALVAHFISSLVLVFLSLG